MTIAEVCKQCEISADTLRYYERVGVIPPVRRAASGIRNYTETDVNWVQFVKYMRSAGISIEALVEYLQLFRQGDRTLKARKAILMEQRMLLAERVATQQAVLERLDHKIENYETMCAEWERKHLIPKEGLS